MKPSQLLTELPFGGNHGLVLYQETQLLLVQNTQLSKVFTTVYGSQENYGSKVEKPMFQWEEKNMK